MRKTLAALGFMSSLLVCTHANADITILPTSALNLDPALTVTETFDTAASPLGQTGTFTTPFATFSGNGVVSLGTTPNVSAAPFFGTGPNPPNPGTPDPTRYLATTGTETITFAASHNIFALYWGSIDTFNTITFKLGATTVATFGGSAVLPPANGNQGSFATNADAVFSNIGLFDTVLLSSTQAAFEVDNVQVGDAVPESSTWLMMILGFLSVGFVAYRRKSNVMQFRMA